MHTAHLLTVSQHALCGEVSAWGGCLTSGVSAQGMSAQGVSAQGVSAQVGVFREVWKTPPGNRRRHPPVDRMADMCKNITLPQLRCGR